MATEEQLEQIIKIMNSYKPLDNEHIVISLDVEKIDKNWKGSIFYVPHIFKNFSSRNLYNESKAYLMSITNNIIPPVIEVEDDLVRFLDGRYEFAVLRDCGCKSMPFIVFLDQLETMKELFVDE